jgi:hypothetical protein
MFRTLIALLRLPLDDYTTALGPLGAGFRVSRVVVLVAAAALSWWVYVPIHELAHALGCLAGGGSVTRLEIDAFYGAAWLQRVFPFVAVGSDYAGQLTGFDTGGSDLTYLLTDFLPFALTILVGVPMLRIAARMRPSLRQAAVFGASLPLAMAPFTSLVGDYYEMGSIVVSRAVSWIVPAFDLERWRSDDLVKLAGELFSADGGTGDAAGLAVSSIVGVVLAFATYAAGAVWAAALGLRPTTPSPVRERAGVREIT